MQLHKKATKNKLKKISDAAQTNVHVRDHRSSLSLSLSLPSSSQSTLLRVVVITVAAASAASAAVAFVALPTRRNLWNLAFVDLAKIFSLSARANVYGSRCGTILSLSLSFPFVIIPQPTPLQP